MSSTPRLCDYMFVGDTRDKLGQDESARIVEQDSYGTVNLRIGAQRDSLAFALFGRNLTDERAVVNLSDPMVGGFQYLMRPREIGIEVRYSHR